VLTKLEIELLKLWRKPRTYLGFAGMAAIVGLVLMAMKLGDPFSHMQARLAQDFIVVGSFVNAPFLTRHLLDGIVYTFLPLFACLVCGDLIVSEAADGTLRAVLCRPVSRTSVVVSKYAAGALYVLALVFGTGMLAYVAGWAFLGRGSLVELSRGVWVFPEGAAILRLLAAYGLVAASMLAVGSIALAISTFLSNSNGSIIGAMVVMYSSAIVGEIEYFARVKPYLFTTYMDEWRHLFVDPIDTGVVLKCVAVMAAYAAVSLAIGLVVFCRRDVLS